MSTLDPLYWTGTQFSILHVILFRRAWRGLHFYLGWGYNHKVPIWIMLRRAWKKVEIFFFIFDLIYFYKECKNFTFWWEWKTCYYLATPMSWILFIWFVFKTQWDSFYAVDKQLYIYSYIHFWVLWCGWQTELATLTADFYHFLRLVSRQVIFQYIQCNLDLVTLLVSTKTITKSHKMEKWSLQNSH